MRIIDYIQDADKYLFYTMTTHPFKDLLTSSDDEQYMLVPYSMTVHRAEFVTLFKEYYLVEMFDISNCFLGTWKEPYMFLHLSRQPVEHFKLAYYCNPAHLYRDDIYDPNHGKLRNCDNYLPEYLQYLDKLDSWREKSIIPEDIKYTQIFRQVPYQEFNSEVIYTRYYLDYYSDVRAILKGEDLVLLEEVADILLSHFDSEDGSLDVRAFDQTILPRYPYVPELDTIKYCRTSVQVHNGDIVEHNGQFFLVDKEADFAVYAPPGAYVIRANKSIIPEYLYLYLTSRIASRIRSVISIPDGDGITANSRRIEEFPIVVPKEDNAVYLERFAKVSSPDERVYQPLKTPSVCTTVGEILEKEYVNKIKLNNRELLQSHLESDIEELNDCYAAKAYKSVALLAGAILEAFLIDWLSEIDGRDYFNDTLIVNKTDKDTNQSYTAFATLEDYIDSIQAHFDPLWISEATNADYIREKRNLIHAKLCLSHSQKLNDEICQTLIRYLKDIIESRRKLS